MGVAGTEGRVKWEWQFSLCHVITTMCLRFCRETNGEIPDQHSGSHIKRLSTALLRLLNEATLMAEIVVKSTQ
jgi:DNA gyrase/topoisomerase IV subunit B